MQILSLIVLFIGLASGLPAVPVKNLHERSLAGSTNAISPRQFGNQQPNKLISMDPNHRRLVVASIGPGIFIRARADIERENESAPRISRVSENSFPTDSLADQALFNSNLGRGDPIEASIRFPSLGVMATVVVTPTRPNWTDVFRHISGVNGAAGDPRTGFRGLLLGSIREAVRTNSFYARYGITDEQFGGAIRPAPTVLVVAWVDIIWSTITP